MDSITITRPDDWHIHLRDGDALTRTVTDAARYFGRAIVMPNLTPPVNTAEEALSYRQRILAAAPTGSNFDPLMVLYLTDNTSAKNISEAHATALIYAAKLYPAGATTNSDSGVTDLSKIYPALAAMEKCGMPLLVHGEVVDAEIDIFDREKAFIERHLKPLMAQFPELKIVFEHITTEDAVQFVMEGPSNLGATITAHHLLYNRNDLLVGGIKPHYYCLPVLKRNTHQKALIGAATSGHNRFFLGTDSAPHTTGNKENACGCAGIYSAHGAIEFYAEAFAAANALDKLEGFASFHGPDFYGLPRNSDTITLIQQPQSVPAHYAFGSESLTPLRADESIAWTVQS